MGVRKNLDDAAEIDHPRGRDDFEASGMLPYFSAILLV
jgi:hypothetical protein